MKKGVSGDRNSGFFKKRYTISRATLDVHITEEEAALAQSNYNVEKITEIQSRFTGGEVLLVPGRLFIREGPLWKVCRKNVKKRQFFLFNDILVYGSIVANRCNNQHILPLAKMSASSRCEYTKDLSLQFSQEQLGEGLDVSNAFQVNHADKSFHVVAISAADKTNWLSNLLKYIKKATPPDTAVETRAIWVPDSLAKDCMVCGSRFSAFIRKHHCRKCGRVVCSSCSPHRLDLCPHGGVFSGPMEERVCTQCFQQQNGHTPVPPPQPASTVLATPQNATPQNATPQNATPSDSPNTSDLEDESTDTEDTDDSREIESPPHPREAPPHPHEAPPHPREAPPHPHEAPPHPHEAPPHPHEAPPHPHEAPPHPHEAPPHPHEAPPIAQVALPTCVPSLCPPTMEEKRPTPPPRKKKMKAHSEAAASMLRSNDVGVSAVKSSLEVHLAPEEKSEQTVGKEVVQRVHRRKKKYFCESQGASSVQDASPEEGNETCLKDSEAPQRGNESIFGDIPTSWNQETSAEDKDSSPGDKGFIPGGKDFIPGGTDFIPGGTDFIPGGDKLAQDDKLKESVEACSPTHTASQLIQGSANSRKSARRRQKFVVDHTS